MGALASQIISLTIVYSTVYPAQIKQGIKAPRHWPLCWELTGTGEFPAQMASNAENVSTWWRHHDRTDTAGCSYLSLPLIPASCTTLLRCVGKQECPKHIIGHRDWYSWIHISLQLLCFSECDDSFNGPMGEITSPNYPSDYFSNLRCEYHITVEEGKVCASLSNYIYTQKLGM